MGADHSCIGPNREITFSRDGLVILRFIRDCAGGYWGGGTQAQRTGADPPPHMLTTVHWMLDKLAEFANDSSTFYEIAGHGWRTTISKRMEADRIAGPLGCTENEVRRHFSLSVEILDAAVEVAQ